MVAWKIIRRFEAVADLQSEEVFLATVIRCVFLKTVLYQNEETEEMRKRHPGLQKVIEVDGAHIEHLFN